MGKKSKSVLPKKIAGVKVPKAVRKGRFGELLASPTGQKLLAEAILAAGAVVTAKKAAKTDTAKDVAHKAKAKMAEIGDGAAAKASDANGVLAYALGEAVRSFTEAVRQHDGDRAFAAEAEAAPEESKKKPISYEAGPL